MKNLTFFLGGRDLEMLEIRKLLQSEGIAIHDRALAWGAKLSDYASAIEAVHAEGGTPVTVELTDDCPPDWCARQRLISVDHHGARASEPPSLRQVFALLGLPESRWTRDFALVAVNDVGHVRAMRAMGASLAEMQDIRARDRAAQGITPEQDAAGIAALSAAQVLPLPTGAALLVRLPHGRSATVMDPLAFMQADDAPDATGIRTGLKPRRTLVLCPGEINVFAPRPDIDRLAKAFPRGWSGGQGAEGFFGMAGGSAGAPSAEGTSDDLLQAVVQCLSQP